MPLTKYWLGYQIKKNKMGGARSTYKKGDMFQGFSWIDLRKIEHLEDLGKDGFPRSEMRWNGRNLT
jgi:hypothetical protein